MTQQEFLAHTQLHPDQVNIWYDAGGPPYTLRAITVPVMDFNTPPQDRSRLLASVQQITVPLSTGEGISLDVLSATQLQSPGTSIMPVTRYYYYNIVPVTLPTLGNIGIGTGTLVFSPSLDTFEFADSPYNILEGSLEASRQSTYIMQADRYKIGTLENPTYTGPLNIAELISGSAQKADVQDSNYTTTGWINARYEGSKTDRVDYLTEPAISGKFFEASEFPSGSSSTEINYLITSNQVVYKNYFFAGVGDTPGFNKQSTNFLPNAGYTDYDTVIAVKLNTLGTPPDTLRVGDLITFALTPTAEVMRIDAVGILTDSPLVYSLVVTRGFFGNPEPISLGHTIYKVSQVQIYNVTGNKLSGVPKGQVLVKETGRILRLDSLGFVISST